MFASVHLKALNNYNPLGFLFPVSLNFNQNIRDRKNSLFLTITIENQNRAINLIIPFLEAKYSKL